MEEMMKEFMEKIDKRLANIENTMATKEELGEFRDSMNGEMEEFRNSMNGELSEFRNSMNGELSEFRNSMNGELTEIRNTMATKEELGEFRDSMNGELMEFRNSMNGELSEIRNTMATKEDVADIPLIKQAVLETREILGKSIGELKEKDNEIEKILAKQQKTIDFLAVKSVEQDAWNRLG